MTAALVVLALLAAPAPELQARGRKADPVSDAKAMYAEARKAAAAWSPSAYLVSIEAGFFSRVQLKTAGKSSRMTFLFYTTEGCRPGFVDSLKVTVSTVKFHPGTRQGRLYVHAAPPRFVSDTHPYGPVDEKWTNSTDAAKVLLSKVLRGANDSGELKLFRRFGRTVWVTGREGDWRAVDAKTRAFLGTMEREGSTTARRPFFEAHVPAVEIPTAYSTAAEHLKRWGDPGEVRLRYLSAESPDYKDFMNTGRVKAIEFHLVCSKPEYRWIHLRVYGDKARVVASKAVDVLGYRKAVFSATDFDGKKLAAAARPRLTYRAWSRINGKGTVKVSVGSMKGRSVPSLRFVGEGRGKALSGNFDPVTSTFPEWEADEKR